LIKNDFPFFLDLKSRLAGGGGSVSGATSVPDHLAAERISFLEKKLFAVQEELTELHRRRSENAQQIIDQVRCCRALSRNWQAKKLNKKFHQFPPSNFQDYIIENSLISVYNFDIACSRKPIKFLIMSPCFFQSAILKENEKKLSETLEELKKTKLKLAASNEEVVFLQSGT